MSYNDVLLEGTLNAPATFVSFLRGLPVLLRI